VAGVVIDGCRALAWPGRWTTRLGGAPHGGGRAAVVPSAGTRRLPGGGVRGSGRC
jgi:hypothetical protein